MALCHADDEEARSPFHAHPVNKRNVNFENTQATLVYDPLDYKIKRQRCSPVQPLAAIEDIIEDARNGRMVILVDDEDRENEGIGYPRANGNLEAINFMASHGRGLICLSMMRQQIERLQIPMMPQSNHSRFRTAFTVSIEAREGVSNILPQTVPGPLPLP